MTDQMAVVMKLLFGVFFTLAAISFLYRDNPLYKFAEHFFVGIAAGYIIVSQFHTVFLPKLWSPLVHKGLMGGTLGPEENLPTIYLLIIPGILGFMTFAQFSRKYAWVARWPMAIVIGSFSGAAVTGFASGDFIPQIQANVLPMFEAGAWTKLTSAPMFTQQQLFAFLDLLSFPVLIIGTFCCLVYFFFSKEHRGATGAAATIGIWFLMVSFGASYGRTVATRVSLFLERATFLLTERTMVGGVPIPNWWVTAAVGVLMIGFLVIYFGVLRRGRETAG